MRALDLFAGAGGWDIAARSLGWDVDRVEKWAPANETARMTGLSTVHADVTTFRPTREYGVMIASPPCPTFAPSGLLSGRKDMDVLIHAARHGGMPMTADPRSALVLEPLRILREMQKGYHLPTFLAWENAAAVLPIWEACLPVFRSWGYSATASVLRSEEYGVPQTRERALLVARRDGRSVSLPTPTHSRYWPKNPTSLTPGLLPWVSAGRALGLTGGHIGFPRRADRMLPGHFIEMNGVNYRARDLRSVDLPGFGVTEKARSWSYFSPDGERRPISLDEAMILQTFPIKHPFQGTRSVQFLQCANAVPPVLATAILTALTEGAP